MFNLSQSPSLLEMSEYEPAPSVIHEFMMLIMAVVAFFVILTIWATVKAWTLKRKDWLIIAIIFLVLTLLSCVLLVFAIPYNLHML
jgi:hypothetical protein